MDWQIPLGKRGSWARAIRMAPERMSLSPEWEARARELRRDWTRVAAQVEALARALGPRGLGVLAGTSQGVSLEHETSGPGQSPVDARRAAPWRAEARRAIRYGTREVARPVSE